MFPYVADYLRPGLPAESQSALTTRPKLFFFQQVAHIEAPSLALKALNLSSGKLQLRRQYPDPVFHVS
jgi:hypothetical protein|tara:strand:+ start:621 stop:824 length:204 start_codon:yes stop_codon:yes gene_type:complete